MGLAEDAAVMVACNKGYMVQVTFGHFHLGLCTCPCSMSSASAKWAHEDEQDALLQGSGVDSGSNMAVNGWCVKAAERRVWVTMLLATCWLALGSLLGAGMLWLYENRFRRSNVNAALYHELSMDTGF